MVKKTKTIPKDQMPAAAQQAASIPLRTRTELANLGIPDRIMDAMAQDREVVIVDEQYPQLRMEISCRYCNRIIPPDANYCPYCAHPVIKCYGERRNKSTSSMPSAAAQQAAVSEPVPITRQEIAEFKVMFPPEVVDRALAKRSLVLMDECKVPP